MEDNIKFLIKTPGEYYNEYQLIQFQWLNEELIKKGYSITNMGIDTSDNKYFWEFTQK